jgi:N-acyl-D-aspartate/D-glutamate deacylase
MRFPCVIFFLISGALGLLADGLRAGDFDLVISGGRVIDPETGLDAIRDIGVREGKIVAISETLLTGAERIDASGLVVSPGFIDLHQHAWDDESLRLKAQDGVTSVFELEVGTADVDGWYRERVGKSRLHHGVSVGHIQVRMKVMGDPPSFLPAANSGAGTIEASEQQIEQMAIEIQRGLDSGAVAVGFGLAYTPVATASEVERMFQAAATNRASCHIHLRGVGQNASATAAIDAVQLAKTTGASLCIVHLQAGARSSMPELIRLIEAWQATGQDVTGEVYPWTAGMTEIQAAIFSEGFQERLGIDYQNIQWAATGERLNRESFERYRQEGGLIIVHNNSEEAVDLAINHPRLMIASDGLKGHPRNAGTFARVLGVYVREKGDLALMTALRKMTLLPAQQLEPRVPAMKKKGRLQIDCDADLTLFDLATVNAGATYEQPLQPSTGIPFVIVDGIPIVREGKLSEGAAPGRAIRANSP